MIFENLKKNDIVEEDMALYVCATVTTTTSTTTAPSPSSNWAQYSSSRLRNVSDYENPNLPGCYLLREVNEFDNYLIKFIRP